MENHIKHNYYLLVIEQDMFKGWILKRIFGNLHNKRYRTIIQTYTTETDARQMLTEVEYKIRQNGYIYVDSPTINLFIPTKYKINKPRKTVTNPKQQLLI